jgi:hypothetical protein
MSNCKCAKLATPAPEAPKARPPISHRNRTTENIPAAGRLLLGWDLDDSPEFKEEFNKVRKELEELRNRKKKWDEQLEAANKGIYKKKIS